MRRTHPVFLLIILGACLLLGCGMPDEGLMARGDVFNEEGEYADAIASYEKLARLYPRSELRPVALYKAGIVYTNSEVNDFEAAVARFQQVIDDHSDSEEASRCQFMIGFVYANSVSDTAKARAAYMTFLEKYPDHELAASVQWELDHLGMDINDIPELKGIEDDSRGERQE